MTLGQISVTSLNKAKRKKRRFGAVVTIEDPGQRNPLRFHHSPHPEHLVLKFEDIDFVDPTIALPREEHVLAVLDFGRKHAERDILVHCKAGIARSTAMALALLADRLGKGYEREAVDHLLNVRPEAIPNLVILGMTDRILERDGALVDAWMEVENSDPEYAAHRVQKRDIFVRRPDLFAKAREDVTGSIMHFTEKSLMAKIGKPL
jgi:Predicted protein tyrosine phosphatase